MRSLTDLINDAISAFAAHRLDEAESLCRKILDRQPYNIDALMLLGHTLHARRDFPAALQQFQKAANIAPQNPAAHYGIAAAFHAMQQLERALAACERVIQLRPDFANAHMNVGTLLSQLGRQREALKFFRRAVELAPNEYYAHSNLLYAMFFLADFTPEQIYREHVAWDELHARRFASARPPPANDRSPDRKLKIGYVSPDFREHSVSFFFEPLLRAHDRANFEVTCYSSQSVTDAITDRLRALADHWRDISALDDDQAASLIRADAIDILVDLAGHSSQHRLLLFARKPAPIQVTYLGYPGTTGLSSIDYRITDIHADPPSPSSDALHSEKLIRLPQSAWCYQPPAPSPEILPREADAPITFASFNRVSKITPDAIAAWSKILANLPTSRLLLKSQGLSEPSARQHVLNRFAQHNIPPERLQIIAWLPSMTDHLNLYNRVDIALDTFPYNGTTTTCEALWMATPVITLAGQSHASRVGVSLLTNASLPDLIATSIDDYIAKATTLAQDQNRLNELRKTLRQKLQSSPLMNPTLLATQIESAYRTAWREWCQKAS